MKNMLSKYFAEIYIKGRLQCNYYVLYTHFIIQYL
jgi:hypothetical protein